MNKLGWEQIAGGEWMNAQGVKMSYIIQLESNLPLFHNGVAIGGKLEMDGVHQYYVLDNGQALWHLQTKHENWLKKIANEPAMFLQLPTKAFKDREEIDDLIEVVKNSLRRDLAQKDLNDEIDEEYVAYIRDLNTSIASKINMENENLRQMDEKQALKNDALDAILTIGR